jgi:hypothetical protein
LSVPPPPTLLFTNEWRRLAGNLSTARRQQGKEKKSSQKE